MNNWQVTSTRFQNAVESHRRLKSKFEAFANYVDAVIRGGGQFTVSGVSCDMNLERGMFALTFADRTVTYVFGSFANGKGVLVGKVDCYLRQDFPEPSQSPIGTFTFDRHGKTDQLDGDENEEIFIDNDLYSVLVALHFLNESLSR